MEATAKYLKNVIASPIQLPPAVIEIWRFASTDDTRPNLSYVELSATSKEFIAVATDGHRLLKVTVPGDFDVVGKVLIPASLLKQASKLAKNQPVTLNHDGETLTVTIGDSAIHKSVGALEFPDWEQVMPKSDRVPVGTMGFNPCFVGDFGDYLKKVLGRGGNIGVVFKGGEDSLSPMMLTATHGTFIAEYVLMPMQM